MNNTSEILKNIANLTNILNSFIENDFRIMKDDIASLKNEVVKLKNHNQHLSDSFEEHATEILKEYLQGDEFSNVGKYVIKTVFLKDVYDINGEKLTDLDGCLLVENIDNTLAKEALRHQLINFRGDTHQFQSLRAKFTSWHNESLLYVVESKNHFDKTDIDKKIKQMINFQNIIKQIKEPRGVFEEPLSKDINFINMVDIYEMTNFTTNIILYFASNCFSPLCQKYVSLIHSGINELQYKEIVFMMLLEYKGWRHFLKDVDNFLQNRLIVVKTNLKIKSFDEAIMLLEDIKYNNAKAQLKLLQGTDDTFFNGLSFFKKFLAPFSTLCENFEWAKGRLGIIYNGQVKNVYISNIQPYNNTVYQEESVNQAYNQNNVKSHPRPPAYPPTNTTKPLLSDEEINEILLRDRSENHFVDSCIYAKQSMK